MILKGLLMSTEYKEETRRKTEKRCEDLLQDAPLYVKAFYNHMNGGHREALTLYAYIQDVLELLKYEKEMLVTKYGETELKDMPVEIFSELTTQDMEEYRDYLRKIRLISNTSSKRKLSGISVFYKFLNTQGYTERNPMVDFDYPAVNKHRIIRLDAELSNQLLSGVMANDKYLLESGEGLDRKSEIIDMPEDIRMRRERLVMRNYAIIRLFLGAGLRVSELVGLDLKDINFRNSSVTIVAKGGDETEVYFNESVADALRAYLYGTEIPTTLLSDYPDNEIQEMVKFCRKNAFSPAFSALAKEAYGEANAGLIHNLELVAAAMRRHGRAGLNPKKGCDAVFITTRGQRMTVRAVELMIKEMARTYLPDYDDKDLFTPHKLRATCATRILTQTGNVALASQQLNHKGVAVTAAFYAELQKENQKAQIQKLDVDEW